MGIILEKMFSLFEWLYVKNAIPWYIWLIAAAIVIVMLVMVLGEMDYATEKILGFPVHLFISLTFMILMHYNTFPAGKEEYGYHMFDIVKDEVPFVLGDIGTWALGLKWSFFHFLLVVIVSLLVGLKKGIRALLCLLLTVPLTLAIFRAVLVVKGIFLIGGVAYICFETAIIILSVAGWLIALVPMGDFSSSGGSYSVPSQNMNGGTGGHADNFNVLRMPTVIKDEYGNTYTRQYVDVNGTYAEYAGNSTVVTIYSENVKHFSATAEGHYFTW